MDNRGYKVAGQKLKPKLYAITKSHHRELRKAGLVRSKEDYFHEYKCGFGKRAAVRHFRRSLRQIRVISRGD